MFKRCVNAFAKVLAFIAVFAPFSLYANIATIDLLLVHSKGVTDLYGGDPRTRFTHLIETSNQIYRDSGVNLQLNIAHTVEVNYNETSNAEDALTDITSGIGAFSEIAQLRETYGADMVVFFRPYHSNHGSCGLAWIGGADTNGDFSASWIKSYQYSHVAVNSCGDYVTAHELGHNLGLRHSRVQDGSGGTTAYALGHGVDGLFSTIMAYQSAFNVDYWTGKVYKFSNPDITCKGMPCGVDRFQSQGADARYALNLTGPQVAGFLTRNETITPEQQAAYQQLQDAETEYNNAVSAYNASSNAYAIKKLAETTARTTIDELYTTIKAQTMAYEKALEAYANTLNKAAQYQTKAAIELERNNTAKYQAYTADYNAYTAQAGSFLAQAQSMEPSLTASVNELTQAIIDYQAARNARMDEKDNNTLLKTHMRNTEAVYNTLLEQYNSLLGENG